MNEWRFWKRACEGWRKLKIKCQSGTDKWYFTFVLIMPKCFILLIRYRMRVAERHCAVYKQPNGKFNNFYFLSITREAVAFVWNRSCDAVSVKLLSRIAPVIQSLLSFCLESLQWTVSVKLWSRIAAVIQSLLSTAVEMMVAVVRASLFCSGYFAGLSKLSRCLTRAPKDAVF